MNTSTHGPMPGHHGAGRFRVPVPEEATTHGFRYTLSERLSDGMAGEPPVRATLPNGAPLPDWLRFIPATRSFTATAVPPGALPLDVRVAIGTRITCLTLVPGEAPS